MAQSVQLTRVLDSKPVDIWPDKVVSVRDTSPDDAAGTPQGTLICSMSVSPDNRVVVKEARNIVVQLINAKLLVTRPAAASTAARK